MDLNLWLCYGAKIEDARGRANDVAGRCGCETVLGPGGGGVMAAQGSITYLDSEMVMQLPPPVGSTWEASVRAACVAAGVPCGEIRWWIAGAYL